MVIAKKEILINEDSKLLISKSSLIHSSQVNIPNILKNIWPFLLISFLNMSILTLNLVIVSFLSDGINMAIAVGLITPFLALFIHSTIINGMSLGSITKNSTDHIVIVNNEHSLDFAKIKSSLLAAIFYSLVMVGLYLGSSYGYMHFELNNTLGQAQSSGFDYIFITSPIIFFYAIKSWALKILISFNKLKIVVAVIIVQIILSIGLSVIFTTTTSLGVLGAGLGLLIASIVISLFMFWYLLNLIGIHFFFLKIKYSSIFKSILSAWKSTLPFILISLIKCVSLVATGLLFSHGSHGHLSHQILIATIISFNFMNLALFIPRGLGHGLTYIFAKKRTCINDFFRHKKELMGSIVKLWLISSLITVSIFALYPAFTYCIVLDSNSLPDTISAIGQSVNIPYNGINAHYILETFISKVNVYLIPIFFMFSCYIVGINLGLIFGPTFNLVLGKNIIFYWILSGFAITFFLIFAFGVSFFDIPFAIYGVYIIIVTIFVWKRASNKLTNKYKGKYIAMCEECASIDIENKDIEDLDKFLRLRRNHHKKIIKK